MSAEKTREENTARKDEEPLFPPAVPFWMRVTVTPEDSAVSQQPEAETIKRPECLQGDAPESDETYAVLLRAIEGTEIAKRLGGVLPPTQNRPREVSELNESQAVKSTPDLKPPVAGPPEASESESGPTTNISSRSHAIGGSAAPDETSTAHLKNVEGTQTAAGVDLETTADDESAKEHGSIETAATAALKNATEPPATDTTVLSAAEAEQVAVKPSQAAEFDDSAEHEEICAALLRAIEDSVIAKRLGVVAPRNAEIPEEPMSAEVPQFAAVNSEPESTVVNSMPGSAEEKEPPALTAMTLSEMEDVPESEEISGSPAQTIEVAETAAILELAAPSEDGVAPQPVIAEVEQPAAFCAEVDQEAPSLTFAAQIEAEPAAIATASRSAIDESANSDETHIAPVQRIEAAETTVSHEVALVSDCEVAQEPAAAAPTDDAVVQEPAVAEPSDNAIEIAVIPPPDARALPAQPAKSRRGSRTSASPVRRAGTGKGRRTGKERQTAPRARGRAASGPKAPLSPPTDTGSDITPLSPASEPELPSAAVLIGLFDVPSISAALPAAAELAIQGAPAEPEPVNAASLVPQFDALASALSPPTVRAAPELEIAPADLAESADSNLVEEAPLASAPPLAAPIAEPALTVSPPIPPAPARKVSTSTPKRPRRGAEPNRAAVRSTGEYLDRAESHLQSWFLKWFDPPDPRRHSQRMAAPPLAAYHWSTDVPKGLKIADISAGGMYVLTDERWTEGVIVSLTLQRTDMEKGSAESWIAVDFVVTRWCEGGIAGEFIPRRPGLTDAVAGRAMNCADKKTLERFVAQLASEIQP